MSPLALNQITFLQLEHLLNRVLRMTPCDEALIQGILASMDRCVVFVEMFRKGRAD